VVADGTVAGILGISDPIKQSTPAAIKALHQLGLKVIMATGDNRKTAEAVGRELRIDEVRAELNPKDKNEIIKELRRQRFVVAMAGDGINDAPFFGILLSPMIAGAAMSFSSVSVIGNALRLKSLKL
jgi:Cu+-exporting ATPase